MCPQGRSPATLVALTSSSKARAASACTYPRASLDLRVTLPKECRWGCKAMISRVFAWHFLSGRLKLSWKEFHRKLGKARTAYHWQVHHTNQDPSHTLGNRLSIVTHSRVHKLIFEFQSDAAPTHHNGPTSGRRTCGGEGARVFVGQPLTQTQKHHESCKAAPQPPNPILRTQVEFRVNLYIKCCLRGCRLVIL